MMNFLIRVSQIIASLFCINVTEAFVCTNKSPRLILHNAPALVLSSQHALGIMKAMKDDFDGFSNDEIEAANDLAKEFYQQMKQREQQQQPKQGNEETWEKKKQSMSDSSTTEPKKRKFTGRFNRGELDSTGTPSAGLFATQNGTVYAMPAPRRISIGTSSRNSDRLSPREEMMRREFNLVSLASNELTLIIQGALVLVILTFAIYIGASGGITDGSDRFGASEGYINEYNGMGESLDYSSYTNDDSSKINNQIIDGFQKKEDSSVWL